MKDGVWNCKRVRLESPHPNSYAAYVSNANPDAGPPKFFFASHETRNLAAALPNRGARWNGSTNSIAWMAYWKSRIILPSTADARGSCLLRWARFNSTAGRFTRSSRFREEIQSACETPP